MADKKDNILVRSVGRRKTAAARVRFTTGKGVVTINGRTLEDYFPTQLWQEVVMSPLVKTSREGKYDVSVKIIGSGVSSQADAVRHGIARALVKLDEELKPILKAEGYLSRDSRAKERKKPGLRKARRGRQWRKR